MNKNETITVRLDSQTGRKIEKIAAKVKMSKSDLLRKWIAEGIASLTEKRGNK
jgi:predicted transcriptional regulator